MYKPIQVYTAGMDAASDTCTVTMPQGYDTVFCAVPTLSTSCELAVYGSADGSTFYQVFFPVSSGVAAGSMLIGSGLGTNGGAAELPGVGAFKVLRLVASAAISIAADFTFHCS